MILVVFFSFNNVLEKNREACFEEVVDPSKQKKLKVIRSDADKLKRKLFVFPSHCSLQRVPDFQRDADGNFIIEPYHQLTAENKEFAARPARAGYGADPPEQKTTKTWFTSYLEGGPGWIAQRQENLPQLNKFVEDSGLIRIENDKVTSFTKWKSLLLFRT